MSELNDLVSQASSNQSNGGGRPSLLDYASNPQEEASSGSQEGQSQHGQNPMLSEKDVSEMSRRGSISSVEEQIDPGVAGLAERDRNAITQAGVDPELIFEGNAEKFGKSLVAGVGVVVNDMGNMMDYAAMTLLPDEVRKADTFKSIVERLPSAHALGDSLQNWGKVHQSPGLDEFTLDDLFKVEFWATDVAKTLPYMASMLIPGAQGVGAATKAMTWAARGAAKKGLFGSAKRLMKTRAAGATAKAAGKGANKAAEGAKAAIGGEGLMGALATSAEGEIALSTLGSGIAGFLGSGIATTTVIGAGLSGDVYNRALDMGMTEEEAQTAAHGTFVDNSAWFAFNGMSWMINFGGLSGKAFKAFNKAKGGAEGAKALSKTFGQRVSQHMMKGVATGTVEGTEEMFQETYEEWIGEANLAEARGEEFPSYSDFFQSKNNRKTLGVSFAAGFLMGGRAGLMNSIADNGRTIVGKRVSLDDDINNMEGMNEAQRRIRVNEVVEAAVREDQIDGLNGYLDKMVKNGKITNEQRAEYDTIVTEYAEIASTLPFQEELTEVGQQAVFNIKVRQNTLNKASKNLEGLKAKSIAEANDNLEGEPLTKKLEQIENEHEINMNNVNKEMSESKTALAKVLSGKKHSSSSKEADQTRIKDITDYVASEEFQTKASESEKSEIFREKANLESRLKENSYAIDEAASMSEAEFEQFTNKGVADKTARVEQEVGDKVDKVTDKVKDLADKGAEAGKGFWSKAKSMAGKTADYLKTKVKDAKASQAIKKITRPIEAEIQKMVSESAKSSDIATYIMSKATPEQIKATGLTESELRTHIEGLADTYTKSEEDQKGKDKEEEATKKEFTSDELANDQDTIKSEVYETIDDDGRKVLVTIMTNKDGSRRVTAETFDENGKSLGKFEAGKFGKNNTLSNEKAADIFGFVEQGEATLKLVETKEGFEAHYSKKQVENRKAKRRSEAEKLKDATSDTESKEGENKPKGDLKSIFEAKVNAVADAIEAATSDQDIHDQAEAEMTRIQEEFMSGKITESEMSDKLDALLEKAGGKPKKVSKPSPEAKTENIEDAEIIEETFIDQVVDAAEALVDNVKKGSFKVKVKEVVSSIQKTLPSVWKGNPEVTSVKKSKIKDSVTEEVEDSRSLLSYYATLNPGVEAAIIEAASKKFPKHQLLLLRDVIDEQGAEVVGYAMGSAVMVRNDANLASTIMHEYGHIYYNMLKDNPSFIRGVSKVIGTDTFSEIKKAYAEEVLYMHNGRIIKGGEVFMSVAQNVDGRTKLGKALKEDLGAIATAQLAGDKEVEAALVQKMMNTLMEKGVLEVLPDSAQENIIEETFVTLLGPRVATKLDLLFEKPAEAKEYKSFIKRITQKIATLVTPADAKKILAASDRSFDQLTLDEMYDRIADDFSKGTQGGSLDRAKKSKLHPTLSSAVSIALNKIKENDFNNMSTKEISEHIIEFAKKDQFFNKKGGKLDISQEVRDEVELRVAIEKERRAGFSLNVKYNENGVGSIYKASGLEVKSLSKADKEALQDLEDEQSDEAVNIMSDDIARMKSMDNSTTNFIKAIMRIANPKGKRDTKYQRTESSGSVEALLYSISQKHRDNLLGFIKEFGASNNKNIVEMRRIMNEHMSRTQYLAALNDVHNNYRNKVHENISNTTLTDSGQLVENLAIASSERYAQSKMISRANDIYYKGSIRNKARTNLLTQMAAAKKAIEAGGKISKIDAIRMAAPILMLSDGNQYLDLDQLAGARIKSGNKILSLEDFMTEFVQKSFSNKATDLKNGKAPILLLSPLVKTMVVSARAKNSIKSVRDVSGENYLAFNMNNSLQNSSKHLVELAKTAEGRKQLEDEYLTLDKDGNVIGNEFIQMLLALGANGSAESALDISFDGGVIDYGSNKNSRYVDKTKDDFVQFDLEKFAVNYDSGKPGDVGKTYYTQPVAVFADAKRRYSITAPMSTTEKQKKSLIAGLIHKGFDSMNYMDGTPVASWLNSDGTYDISEHNEMMESWLKANPDIVAENPRLSKFAVVKNGVVEITSEGKKMIADYNLNYLANSLNAQELLIGKHDQAKSPSDYVKRAKGSIARHDGSLRGTAIEPLIIQDIMSESGTNKTDAASFILPEDVGYIESRVGKRMGHGWKFVYYGSDKRGSDRNLGVAGKSDYYFKTSVQVLTKEFIGDSKELQNIADKLKARRQHTAGGETLNMAFFESAAKKAPSIHGGRKGIEHGAEFDENSDAWNELNNNYMLGDKLVGIDGGNMGIQLPMDNYRETTGTPVQLSGALNNLSESHESAIDELLVLESEILDEALEEATNNIAYEGNTTPEIRLASKKAISSLISKEAMKAVTNGLAKFRNAMNPEISNNLPANVKIYANQIKALIKKSAKVITSGSIAVQGTAVGKGLKGFKTEDGKDYIGSIYQVQKDGSILKKPRVLPAEAIVPAGLKGKHFARVEKTFTNLNEAKLFADKMVTETPGSTDVNKSGVRIKGLDRKFTSVRSAKEFLYNKIAVMPGGEFVILGDQFTGTRVPAHDNQSRVVMEIRGFQTEVLDENGNHRNNVIQVSDEVNKILGSDHDGDTIHMNFKYPDPKNSREAKVNTYMDKVFDLFQDVSLFENQQANLEFEAEVDARIAAIGKTGKKFDQNSPIGASQYFEENVQGSSMIGTVAALNNGMTYLSRYGIDLGNTSGITIDGDRKHNFSNDPTKSGKESLSFQNSVLLNIILDNANNQQATALGINPATVSAVAILNRLGFKTSSLDKIFTSKAAEAYTKFKGKKSISDKSKATKSAAEAALIDMSLAHNTESARKLLAKAKKESLNIDTSGDINSVDNTIQILATLESLEGVSKDVYAINKLVGQHKTSNVASSNTEASSMLSDVNKVLSGKSTLKGEGLNKLADNPVIKSFKNRLVKISQIYQTNNLTGTVHAENTMDIIMATTGRTDIVRRSGDEQSKISKEYYMGVLLNEVNALKAAAPLMGVTNERVPKSRALKTARELESKLEAVMLEGHNDFIAAIEISTINEMNPTIKINKEYINEYTIDSELDAISKAYASLDPELKNDLLLLDFALNEGGMSSQAIQPLFDQKSLIDLSKSIDSAHQRIADDKFTHSPEVVAENIILNNPDIIPTGMYYNEVFENEHRSSSVGHDSGSIGSPVNGLYPVKKVTNKTQSNMIKSNKPHYIKVVKYVTRNGVKSTVTQVLKYSPISASEYKALAKENKNPKNLLSALIKSGKYKSVGEATGRGPKGGKAGTTNYTTRERALKTSLIEAAEKVSKNSMSKKLKFSSSSSSKESGFSQAEPFTFHEYIQDKGHRVKSVDDSRKLKEALTELYEKYKVNFTLAQEFDKVIIQTGKIKTLSNEKLIDYAKLFQKLDPSAVSNAHQSVVMEMAHRAADEQKASRNGKEWHDTGDISWLHSWFGSNNIPGHRPEIQRLVRLMEKEYDTFMNENIAFQKKLDTLTKDLVREKAVSKSLKKDPLTKVSGFEAKIDLYKKWLMGGISEGQSRAIYGNMYDKVDGELVLKDKAAFLKTDPGKAEKAFYEFFKQTTNKYGKISSEALGERWKEGYIPHMQIGLKESMRQRGLFGLYDHMLQGTGDIDMVRVKGVNPVTGKSEVKSFHEWKYLFYAEKGAKSKSWFKAFKSDQFKATASLDVIRKRAEKLAKSGKHEDGATISRSEQEIHGMMGTNMMSRFAKSRGVKSAMFGSADLGRALSQYVNTTMFVYGNENFKGFKSMQPLLDGVIALNKKKGHENAVRYLENVWKKGFSNLGNSNKSGLGRLADGAIHKLVKMTRWRFLGLNFAGGFGNLVVGKYNEYRSKGGKVVVAGEKRYWGDRKKSWALIKGNLNPESFAYDLIQGNDSSGADSIMMAPYIGSEHYIQGAGLVGQFTKEEWARIGADGSVPADMQEKVDRYVDNVVKQQGYGYSKVDQIGIATYSWGKAIMQFKKWMPTALTERFQQETIDRFGEFSTGSNLEAFKFGSEFTQDLLAGNVSVKDFKKSYNKLPKHKQDAVQTFFRGMKIVSALTALSMIFGESDDDEARNFAQWCDDSVDDIMFMTDPRRMKSMLEPASWQLVESGSTMVAGAATLDRDQFIGGLTGISWTAAQVISRTETGVKSGADALSDEF